MSSYPLYIIPHFHGPAGLQLLSIVSFCLLLFLALPQVQSAAISSPSPTASSPSNSSSPSTTAAASDPTSTDPTHDDRGRLSAGGKAGICIGGALGVIAMAIVLGDIWFLHSKHGTESNGDAGISGNGLESQHAAVPQQVSPKLGNLHQYTL